MNDSQNDYGNGDMPGLGDRSLLFLHIPKAAGTSFRDLLGRRFRPDSTIRVGLKDVHGIVQTLARADQYRFVHGHFPYEVVSLFSKRPFLFTVLRDPIERAISAFEFMKRQSAYMQEQAAAGLLSKVRAEDYRKAYSMTLPEFVRNEPRSAGRHLGNLQVELLTCSDMEKRHRYEENYEIILSEKDLDLARERLSMFDAFGLVERLPESVEYLAYALQTRPFGELAWCNKARSRPAVEEIDPETMASLLELTAYDRKLHVFAADLFEIRRREMLRDVATSRNGQARPAGGTARPLPSSFTPGAQLPGDGWYAAESDGKRWFHWTGPEPESRIELGSPDGREFALQIGVLHALRPESLFELEVLVNGAPLKPEVRHDPLGHLVSAPVPAKVLRGKGLSNTITVRVPRLSRPCDSDPGNDDSRTLGIAVHHIALVSIS